MIKIAQPIIQKEEIQTVEKVLKSRMITQGLNYVSVLKNL